MYVFVPISQDRTCVSDWHAFQDMAPHVQILVRFLHSFRVSDGMLTGPPALIIQVNSRQAVRAFLYTCIIADPIQATLWSGPANSICQLFIVILANIFLASRLVESG